MRWLDRKVSLYNSNTDNIGRNDLTFRNILFSKFGVSHIVHGQEVNDHDTGTKLKKLDKTAPGYETSKRQLKNTLQAFTPAALLKTREAGKVEVINRTWIAQIDIDGKDNPGVDMHQLKIDVFNAYDFIAFAAMSCSGDGFYALIAIAEPEMLEEYMKQLFWFFSNCNIVVDTTKGKNVHDLRYLSYDPNMRYREDPEPLKINSYFKTKEAAIVEALENNRRIVTNLDLIAESWLRKLRSCAQGNRMQTIQAAAAALGSKQVAENRILLLNEIRSNPVFEDQREEFLKSASKIFDWGWQHPLKLDLQAQT